MLVILVLMLPLEGPSSIVLPHLSPAEMWAIVMVVVAMSYMRRRSNPMHSIPTVGPSFPLLTYFGAWRYFRHAQDMLIEGCNKYDVFKVPMIDKWLVVVSGPKMNDELRKYPDEVMSALEAQKYIVQTEYTLGNDSPDVTAKKVIAGPLTRKLPQLLPDIVDEMNVTFQELFVDADKDWLAVPALETMIKVIARVTNRVFVGLPYCRDPELMFVVTNFTKEVMKTKTIINMLPDFLKPVVGRRLPWTEAARRRMADILGADVIERRNKLLQHGPDWENKPDDYLTWIIEEDMKNRGSGDSIAGVMEVIAASNFAAIHTSSMALTHALYHLCSNPEFIEPLRKEVEEAIKQHGWTKAAVDNMWKLDSFMKESLRINAVNQLAIFRMTMKDVVFGDGTLIPEGTLVVATTAGTHFDEKSYQAASEFRPFRFSDAREKGSEVAKQQMVTTSAEYISWGHGKHACAGRWFASAEVKVMLAHILLHYDFKLEGGGGRPPNFMLGASVAPNPWAKLMFRMRKAGSV